MYERKIGDIVKKYRVAAGLTENELADKLELWNRYVYLWERGLALPDGNIQAKVVETLQITGPDADTVMMKKPVLNFDEDELVIPGLKEEYRILHISDSHVILMDDDVSEKMREYETFRLGADFFVDNVPILDRFEATCRYIEEHKDSLSAAVFTGDIIDCPFERAKDYLIKKLLALPVPYLYTLGNHDWIFRWQEEAEARAAHMDSFKPITNGDPSLHVKKLGELTLIGIDNTTRKYRDEQVAALEQLLARHENVLLLQHVPFYAETLLDDLNAWWTNGTTGTLLPVSPQDTCENNRKVFDLITAANSPVKAVIAGDIHFHHRDLLGGKVPQFVVQHGAHGGGNLYHIHG